MYYIWLTTGPSLKEIWREHHYQGNYLKLRATPRKLKREHAIGTGKTTGSLSFFFFFQSDERDAKSLTGNIVLYWRWELYFMYEGNPGGHRLWFELAKFELSSLRSKRFHLVRSKERPRNGIFGFARARNKTRRAKKWKRGEGEGEGKEGNFTCAIFRAASFLVWS